MCCRLENICNVCQEKIINWIGSELLRFDKSASKGAFHCLFSNSITPVLTCSLSAVVSNPFRSEYTLSAPMAHTKACCWMQNQRKYTLYSTLLEKKRVELLTIFRSVAGPSHFKQHQQITNNHLFKASCPLGASPFFTTFLLTLFTAERILCHMS